MAIVDNPKNVQLNPLLLKNLDMAVRDWFDKEYPITIDSRQVPVLYMTQERWKQMQSPDGTKGDVRDEKGQLILPLVSVRRTSPDTTVVRYAPRVSETDLTYYRRIATDPTNGNARQPGNFSARTPSYPYLKTKDNVVYETLKIPYPSFVNLNYEIIVWTSYMSHQNIEQENIFQEFAGGRQYFKIHNYLFLGLLKNINDQSNLNDFTNKEKIIKYQFNLELQAYLIDTKNVKITRTTGNFKMEITEDII